MRYGVILIGALLLTLACALDAAQQFGGDAATGGEGGASRRGTGGEPAATGGAMGGSPFGGAGGASDPLRPNGAGCGDPTQCASGVCTVGVCCNQPDSACGKCIGGYVAPLPDWIVCAPGRCEAGTPINYHCRAGACMETASTNCCVENNCAPGTMCTAGQGCDVDTSDVHKPTKCVSWTGRTCDAQPPGMSTQ